VDSVAYAVVSVLTSVFSQVSAYKTALYVCEGPDSVAEIARSLSSSWLVGDRTVDGVQRGVV